MILLPYERFQIETSLSLIEAKKRIESIIVPPPPFGTRFINALDNMFKKSGADQFTGKIDDQGFQIRRIIYYRNSFLPVVKGKFEQGSAGTNVVVKMTLHPVALVFMVIWFGGLGTIVFSSLSVMFSRGSDPILVTAVGMFFFGWLMIQFGFVFEARKAKKIISQLFSIEQNNQAIITGV
jgi:hypothetical protein